MSDRTCTVDGCESPGHVRGWCKKHYTRWQRTGDPEVTLRAIRAASRPTVCFVDGCLNLHYAKGLCKLHYARWLRSGDPGEAERRVVIQGSECVVKGCDRPPSKRNMCGMHYQRWKTYGDPGGPQPQLGREDVTYATAHRRVNTAYGPATDHPCCQCENGAEEWAYDHLDKGERLSVNGRPYSIDLSHYAPMCRSCHRCFDTPGATLMDNPQPAM